MEGMSRSSVQKILDENQQLILAIVENQMQGRQQHCAAYLQKLHKNLFMLGTIGDQVVNNTSNVAMHARVNQGQDSFPDASSAGGSQFMPAARKFTAEEGAGDARGLSPNRPREQMLQPGAGMAGGSVRPWSAQERETLFRALHTHGTQHVELIAREVGTRSMEECQRYIEMEMHRNQQQMLNRQDRIQADLRAPL
ncbi:hypothetical protein GUITHDRAFT_154663 [Guillardia theta CCMP2712]|uniref:SANT domain-containing protein n=1 Tax=Guillardia theta (strain CCMP2712) TaxID=905079 RepID=L1ISA5_GUITC|nr:hypothetical protein GUITHDRAFT_154663 [Guillardia theta CCMP2712]EKX38710.1 hypothetical protein GUITHDRAFT_154663 [Guillardia theta CCMP2712]|eukprot:XP_005825690.1 hypothetical protein GUITHDRAFT_154663 [Guillardia theta CCMP2712]